VKYILEPFFTHIFDRPAFSVVQKFCPSMSVEFPYQESGVKLPYIIPSVIGFEFPRIAMPLVSYVGPILPDCPPLLSEQADLEKWLNSKPKRSVVYLSMGSIFPLDKENTKFIVDGIMKANYSLFWALRKNNQEVLEGLDVDPQRVYISDWTPQFSVLASTAIHSAVLHGGFNSLSEALWNGVPLIGFPQMLNRN